jgi:hypothetical protein
MKNEKDSKPTKFPEKTQPKKEKSGYPHEVELTNPDKSEGNNYSEQNDVPSMPKREFPSQGPAETDFVSRSTGRHTGRMVGHEPGTESL